MARGPEPTHIVDSHAHVLADARINYPFSPRNGALPAWLPERHQTAEKLLAAMDEAGVGQAVLVQYATVHGYDCRYVIDTNRRWPERFVAVCAIDPLAADVSERMNFWVKERGAAGLRIAAPGGPDHGPRWVENRQVWEAVSLLKVPLCVHFRVETQAAGLPVLRTMMERFPEVQVVLDHVANPRWGEGPPSYGLGPVLNMAHLNLILKFATINLERLHDAGVEAGPALRVLVDKFGPGRIMWGSDAPNTPGIYAEMVARIEKVLQSFSATERASVLSGTALETYPQLNGIRA